METQENQFDSSEEKSTSVQENGNESEDNKLQSEVLAKALSSTLSGVIKDFDSKAQQTSTSQDHLSESIDRLTRELDKLLEDAPVPFILQHAAKISVVRKRVSSLNSVLRSVQRRLDNIDRMLFVGVPHQQQQQPQQHQPHHDNTAAGHSGLQ